MVGLRCCSLVESWAYVGPSPGTWGVLDVVATLPQGSPDDQWPLDWDDSDGISVERLSPLSRIG